MKMWFAPGSEVPIYRQMGTQIVLAILSGDLKPGEKLPSTRALAAIRHSSEYRELGLSAIGRGELGRTTGSRSDAKSSQSTTYEM